ncbi:hypothetical protein RF11_13290 [Thelohanellus kitauei]|uniref:Uncharacterized protein n=1 Tax=Thelohanellus kitauei TaxID=669202 RepID=A0A0C2JK40_THEKT|nr:hypothetical protein RF11_13290 [Thelohanellus kitauei]
MKTKCKVYESSRETNIYRCNMTFMVNNLQIATINFGRIFSMNKKIPQFYFNDFKTTFRFGNDDSTNQLEISINRLNILRSDIKDETTTTESDGYGYRCDKSTTSENSFHCGIQDLEMSAQCLENSKYPCPNPSIISINPKEMGEHGSKKSIFIILVTLVFLSLCLNIYMMKNRNFSNIIQYDYN